MSLPKNKAETLATMQQHQVTQAGPPWPGTGQRTGVLTGMLRSENGGVGRRLVQYAHVVDGETEVQSEEQTYPGTHGPGSDSGTGILICSSIFFLSHPALGMNILVSVDCDLDVFTLSSLMLDSL